MTLKRLKRVPFVFEVRDQWPEIPIELGIIKNPLLKKILLCLEKSIYKSSSGIIALSPGMAEGIRSIIGDSRQITIVPNSSDTGLFRPDIDGSRIRNKYEWGQRTVFIHAGAMGRVNDLGFVLDAAAKLSEYKDILFVLIGEGSEKSQLERRIKRERLGNVEIRPAVSKAELPEILAAADVGMVIIGNYPIIEHNSANKFFDSLSAGKPVLLNYSGWQRQVIEQAQAGFGCELCNLDEFIEHVKYLHENRQKLAEMGKNVRTLAVEEFSRDKRAAEVSGILEDTLRNG